MYRDKIRQAYEAVRGDSYTYIDDVRQECGLSDVIFLLCIKALSQSGAIELQPGYEQWNQEKQAFQVGNDTFYGMIWIDTEGDRPAKKTEQTPAFERLFERVSEIVAIMECTQDKKKTVATIKREFPEFSDMSDNTIKTNITAFPFLCSQIKRESESLHTELDNLRQDLDKSEDTAKELDTVRQENEILRTELDRLRQELDKARQESDSDNLRQNLDKGDKDMNMDIVRELQDLKNRVMAIEQTIADDVRQDLYKKVSKQEIPEFVDKWKVAFKEPYYKLYKTINGKLVWIHIGREFSEEKAREKIQEKLDKLDKDLSKTS